MAKTYCDDFIDNINTSDLVQGFDADQMFNEDLTFGDILPTPHIDLTVDPPAELPQTPLDFRDDYDFHDTLKCFDEGYPEFRNQDATNHGVLPRVSHKPGVKRRFSEVSAETSDAPILPPSQPTEEFIDLSQLRADDGQLVGADNSPEPIKSPNHRQSPDSLTSDQAMEEMTNGINWDEEIEVCGSLVEKPASKSYGENRVKYNYLKEQEVVTDFTKIYAKEAFALFTHLVIDKGIWIDDFEDWGLKRPGVRLMVVHKIYNGNPMATDDTRVAWASHFSSAAGDHCGRHRWHTHDIVIANVRNRFREGRDGKNMRYDIICEDYRTFHRKLSNHYQQQFPLNLLCPGCVIQSGERSSGVKYGRCNRCAELGPTRLVKSNGPAVINAIRYVLERHNEGSKQFSRIFRRVRTKQSFEHFIKNIHYPIKSLEFGWLKHYHSLAPPCEREEITKTYSL